MQPRVFIAIRGGLGNQMFEYAAARALSLRLGLPLTLDLTWFDQPNRNHPRSYGLGHLSVRADVMTQSQFVGLQRNLIERRFGLVPLSEIVTIIRDPLGHWPGFFQIAGPVHLSGYWQSVAYFADMAKAIRSDFVFPKLSDRAAELSRQIGDPNSVAVHVRRGDYVNDPGRVVARRGGCCPPEYYARAIDEMSRRRGKLKLFLFSDEPAWVRSNFDARGHDAVVVDFPEYADAPHHDLHLMSLATHHIIANSTFSWWGAWLGAAADQIVIGPSRWDNFTPASELHGTARLYPKSWLRA